MSKTSDYSAELQAAEKAIDEEDFGKARDIVKPLAELGSG